MAYKYTIANYDGFETDLRGIFGVAADVLSDDVIHALPNAPAAELQFLDKVPTAATLMNIPQIKAQLAVLYYAAANCLPAVKTNLLQLETDNKTTGQRFKDALSMTIEDLRKKGDAYVADLKILTATVAETPSLFEVVRPGTDVITGDANA